MYKNELFQIGEKNLKNFIGEKITITGTTDFGFPYSRQVTLKDVECCEYAQYRNAFKITFRQKRKRKDSYAFFHEGKTFAIYKGHVELNADPFGKPETENYDGLEVAIKKSKYSGCDPRYMRDIFDSGSVYECLFVNKNGYYEAEIEEVENER